MTTVSYSAHRTNPLTHNSYLTSPIVEIIVGQGENETTLTAHQTLLLESPSLAETINKFSETEPVCSVILCLYIRHLLTLMRSFRSGELNSLMSMWMLLGAFCNSNIRGTILRNRLRDKMQRTLMTVGNNY